MESLHNRHNPSTSHHIDPADLMDCTTWMCVASQPSNCKRSWWWSSTVLKQSRQRSIKWQPQHKRISLQYVSPSPPRTRVHAHIMRGLESTLLLHVFKVLSQWILLAECKHLFDLHVIRVKVYDQWWTLHWFNMPSRVDEFIIWCVYERPTLGGRYWITGLLDNEKKMI